MHTTLRLTKAERITFRRHFPAWFSISLRPASPKVYVRVGDRADVWLLDSLWAYHCAKNHGQSALRPRTWRGHIAFALGCRVYQRHNPAT